MAQKKKYNQYEILNAINEQYDVYPYVITCFEEANAMYQDLQRLYNLGKVSDVDYNLAMYILNYWGNLKEVKDELNKLIKQSDLFKEVKEDGAKPNSTRTIESTEDKTTFRIQSTKWFGPKVS